MISQPPSTQAESEAAPSARRLAPRGLTITAFAFVALPVIFVVILFTNAALLVYTDIGNAIGNVAIPIVGLAPFVAIALGIVALFQSRHAPEMEVWRRWASVAIVIGALEAVVELTVVIWISTVISTPG